MPKGISLIEMLISILLLAIIGVFAVPNYISFTRNKAITAYASKLTDNMKLAKNEAVKLGQSVIICARTANNGLSCDSGNNWNNGYLVASMNGASLDTILAMQAAPDNSVTLTNPNLAPLIFNSNGSISGSQSFTIYAPSCSGQHMLTVNINAVGTITNTSSVCS